MALTTCPECKHEVSTTSEKCVKCGAVFQLPKNKGTAIVLAFFLGGLGIHRFYLGRNLSGLFYLLFCWTGVPVLLGWAEAVELIGMNPDTFKMKYCQTDLGKAAAPIRSNRWKLQVISGIFGGLVGFQIFFGNSHNSDKQSAKATQPHEKKPEKNEKKKKQSMLYQMMIKDDDGSNDQKN
jgi:hypothetical protein